MQGNGFRMGLYDMLIHSALWPEMLQVLHDINLAQHRAKMTAVVMLASAPLQPI